MEDKKKKRLINILIGVGLCVLILFVVITTIVINYKQQELEEIKDKNDQIKDEQADEEENGNNQQLVINDIVIDYKSLI